MNTFMHPQLFCSALEIIANQGLALSKSANNGLSNLANTSLLITLRELGFNIQLQVAGDKLLITSPAEKTSDCVITTSLSTLYKIKSEHQLTELIKQEQLDIEGNISIARQYATLIENIDIDWPAALENHIGDIATHKLLALAGNLSHKAKFVQKQISSDASEYFIHEKRLVVTKTELSELFTQIYQCKQSVDTLEDKLTQLTQRLIQLDS